VNNAAELRKGRGDLHPGVDVRTVEARNRTGGRVYTYRPDQSPASGLLDLGASWIHDPYRNPFTVMALNLGLNLVETDFEDGVVTDLTGKRWDDATLNKCDKLFERVLFSTAAKARKLDLHNHALEEELGSHLDAADPVLQQLLSEVEFELGCSLRECSATECIDGHWIGAMNDGANEAFRRLPKFYQNCNDLVLPGGFGELFDALESGRALEGTEMQHSLLNEGGTPRQVPLVVNLNEEVVSIDQATVPGKAVVTVKRYVCPYVEPVHDSSVSGSFDVMDAHTYGTEQPQYSGRADGGADYETVEYTVDAVIITAPIGVLQSGGIGFSPSLSAAKRSAIDNTGYGNVVKVIVEFDKVFWPTHAPILCIADPELANPEKRGLLTYFLNGHKVAGKKVLIGYALGDAAAAVDQVSFSFYRVECSVRMACPFRAP
jgi:hypothetical protein